MTTITNNSRIHINPQFRLQWEPAQQRHVLLYPEGMVQLNRSAGEILQRCNTTRQVEDIVNDLQQAFPEAGDLTGDVTEFLQEAINKGWLDCD